MAKYEIGDKFIAEITSIDDSGLGTLYTISDFCIADEISLDKLECYEELPCHEELEIKHEEKSTYTPEDLKNRIFMLSKLLAQTIEKYEEINQVLNVGVPSLDETLKDYSL